jgi:N-methylhydantoinase A/oxoprolinase/acetone carboxylase beta subunit
VGAKRILTFPFGPAFCAFGGCNMDIVHKYELSTSVHLLSPHTQTYLSDRQVFNKIVENLRKQAIADMEWEGLDAGEIDFALELQMRYGLQYTSTRVESPHITLESEDDVKEVIDKFAQTYADLYGADAASPIGGIEVLTFRLITSKRQPKAAFLTQSIVSDDPSPALKGTRDAYWGEGYIPTKVFNYAGLTCGNVVEGPAIIEHDVTTYVIPRGKKFFIDEYMNGQIVDV